MSPNYAERIKPIDRDRFKFAIGVFGAAAALKGPAPNPSQFGLNIVGAAGEVTGIRFTDRPETRGILAVRREFPDAPDFESMTFRIMTMPEVVRMERLSKLGVVEVDQEGQLIVHDAVLYALAQSPYRKSGKLDKAAFLAAVQSEFERIEGRAL